MFSQSMKRFVLAIVAFAAILLVLDVVLGGLLTKVGEHISRGSIGAGEYIRKDVQAPVLIFGSSRAAHHYDVAIIADSLHKGCYNCGMDANGILLANGRLTFILERYNPQLVIYDVMPSFDVAYIPGSVDAYSRNLNFYYLQDSAETRYLNSIISPEKKLQLTSALYRNNQRVLRYLNNIVSGELPTQNLGFLPLHGVTTNKKVQHAQELDAKNPVYAVDSLKYRVFASFIDTMQARNIPLVLFVSPSLLPSISANIAPLAALAKEKGVPFYDFSHLPQINSNVSYFQDAAHMNQKGADVYTRSIIPILKEHLKKSGS